MGILSITSIIDIDGEYLNCFKDNKCIRCGQSIFYPLEAGNFYCLSCISLGRVSTLDGAVIINELDDFSVTNKSYLTSSLKLTQQQIDISNQLIDSFKNQRDHLIWAVTGAGKTEMLFSLIDFVLMTGKRVAIVSPRIDVILELAPRLQKAFAKIDLLTLYGDGDQYHLTNLTLMTSHQLLKFIDAFDSIIVDEVDSFPLDSNPGLFFGIKKARKTKSSIVYLTATPTIELKKQVNSKQLNTSFLPLRFHKGLLPVPTIAFVNNWDKQLDKCKLPKNLLQQIKQLENNQQRFLLFVPRIKDAIRVQQIIQESNIKMTGEYVYANDEKRQEKIQKMRNQQIDYLVTTTILERGVTLPDIDVLVLGADHPIFTENALVQIAGRVGRSKNRPEGLVTYYCQSRTDSINHAIQQINQMNQKAKELLANG